MSDRFYFNSPVSGDRATLTGDEARHVAAVMRAQIGDEVVLFDGSGAEFVARIAGIRKNAVELSIFERREISRELPVELTLAVALPKGDRQKWLVEKAAELGVTRIVPLITERGVAQPTSSALDRLRRSVIEASKQCGRNRLMEIAEPAGAVDYFRDTQRQSLRLIADPTGQPGNIVSLADHISIHTAIGPEGGFSPAELSVAVSAGWQSISLGSRILRIETAAIAVAAWAAFSTEAKSE